MAKKSNKTEHVLRLITKNDEPLQDDFFGIEESAGEKSSVTVLRAVQAPTDEKDLKYEAKIKIAIEPEIELIQKEPKIHQNPEERPESKPEPKPEIRPEPKPEIKPEQKPEPKPEVKMEPAPAAERPRTEKETTGSAMIEDSGHLINIAEILAKEKIAIVMEKMKVCTCQTCFNDVLALTLNSLPTKYVTTDAGKQYFQLDMYKKQYETDVLAALTKACVRVKASPRHL